MKLLEIIRTDRPLERENQVYLDFYPLYHQGPIASSDDVGPYSVEYGVTWDNSGLDTCRAIWAIVYRVFHQSMKHGFDMTEVGTGFRQWLDRGPCWNVEKTLEALRNPETTPELLACLVDSHNPDHEGKLDTFLNNKKVGCRPEGYEP